MERRSHARIRRKQKVGFVRADGSIETLWTVDISCGGMQLLSDGSLRVGDRYPVAFSVFDAAQERYRMVRAFAEVVHRVYDGANEQFRIGIRFLSFKNEDESLYLNYLKGLERRSTLL